MNPNHGITGAKVTPADVKLFMDFIKGKRPKKGKIVKSTRAVQNNSYRDADVYFIDFKHKKLYEVLKRIANTVNAHFNYNIDGIEKAQVIRYKAPSNGYDYHIDLGNDEEALKRKISVSLILNEDYEGGELCFRSGVEEQCLKGTSGDVVAFSSFVPHKVNPVTKGQRYVVIVWFTGSPFK